MDHPLPSFQKPTEVSIYHQSDSCLQICEVFCFGKGVESGVLEGGLGGFSENFRRPKIDGLLEKCMETASNMASFLGG